MPLQLVIRPPAAQSYAGSPSRYEQKGLPRLEDDERGGGRRNRKNARAQMASRNPSAALYFSIRYCTLVFMIDDLILSDPDIMGGTPCIMGTRITVYVVAARLNGGDTTAEILQDYPYITAEQIEAAAYAARVPFVEHPDGRPWRKTRVKTAAE